MDPFQSNQTLIQEKSSIVCHHVNKLDEALSVRLLYNCHLVHWRRPHRLHDDGDVVPKGEAGGINMGLKVSRST